MRWLPGQSLFNHLVKYEVPPNETEPSASLPCPPPDGWQSQTPGRPRTVVLAAPVYWPARLLGSSPSQCSALPAPRPYRKPRESASHFRVARQSIYLSPRRPPSTHAARDSPPRVAESAVARANSPAPTPRSTSPANSIQSASA